ncbi:MAG: PD-(D/E)XK nuclease family protein [Holosporales bacterium]|jgi:hypothetical protein|nr:PD-(D/E)XK nuclease family protein [Holosporales bacterium]
MKDIVANIRGLLCDAVDYLNCIIITPFYGGVIRLTNEFRKSYESDTHFTNSGVIPRIVSFDMMERPAARGQHVFTSILNDVHNEVDGISFLECLQITGNIIKTLDLCQKYSDSLGQIPFYRNLHSIVLRQAWSIIGKNWNAYCAGNIWSELRSLQPPQKRRSYQWGNAGFKLFFIDTIPQCHFPCIDNLRSFLAMEDWCFSFPSTLTLDDQPHPATTFFFREFDAPADEAIAVATIAKKVSTEDPEKKIAIISDDALLLSQIKSELNLLHVKSTYAATNLYSNTAGGTFILDFCNFLVNPGCATLGQLLCSQGRNAASRNFKANADMFLLQIFSTSSEIIDSKLIVKQEASLDEILLITKHYERLAPLTPWIQEIKLLLAPLTQLEETGNATSQYTIPQFIALHKDCMLRFWKLMSEQPYPFTDFFEEIEQYDIGYTVSLEEYVEFIKRILLYKDSKDCPENFDTSTTAQFHFDQDNSGAILLFPTKVAMSYDYDIAILPSMEENAWYRQDSCGKMLTAHPDYQLSLEADTFDYITARSAAVYLTCSATNTRIKHRFLDSVPKQEIADIFAHRTVSREFPAPPKAKASVATSNCPTSFSITDLQLFIDDPYALYAKKILKLYPIVLFSTATDFGRLAHHILDQYFKQDCLARGIGLVDFAQKLAAQNQSSYKLFLRLMPTFTVFEKEFEEATAKNVSIATEEKVQMTFEIDGILFDFHGIIDRADVRPDSRVCIIDYKTGVLPTKSEIKRCGKIQLPLEAKMFEQRKRDGASTNASISANINASINASISVRAIKLRIDVGRSNEVVVPITPEILAELNVRLLQLFEQYKYGTCLFETTAANKVRHCEYSHLSRL